MARYLTGGVNSVVTFPNQGQFRCLVIPVLQSSTPVNLPDVPIPDGVEIALRASITNGNARIFVSDSAINVLDSLNRGTLASGESIGLRLTNLNLIWIGSSANNRSVEIIVEA